MSQIITLTSDFGLQDHYVSAMKAAMLEVAPEARMIDVSHEIPPQDIMAGAWVIRNAAFMFPEKSVHLVVVDPGVGTNRNPVVVKMNGHYFVGPDNGIFSLLYDEYEYEAVKLTNPDFWRDQRSRTFDGRDIFGPVAAHLSKGVPMSELGEPIKEMVVYHWAIPIGDKDGLQGWVLHIDRFGNLITNISESLMKEYVGERKVKIYVGTTVIGNIVNTFGDVEEGDPAVFLGSSGMLEIGINKGNAAKLLSVHKGAQISIVLQK
tara:strand:- start:16626 stop:17414 length:789 start_codon:yes stop_codon:yes gene_type:complete